MSEKKEQPSFLQMDEKSKWTVEQVSCVQQDGIGLVHLCMYKLPNGNHIQSHFERAKDVAVLIGRTKEDKYVTVVQYRPVYDGLTLEFPGGLVEHREDVKEAAIRECEEETGYKVTGNVHDVILSWANPNTTNQKLHVFYADEIVPTGITKQDENEDVKTHLFGLEEIKDMCLNGTIIHMYCQVAFLALYARKDELKLV